MPVFFVRFRGDIDAKRGDAGIEFADLDDAYLNVCATIPDAAKEVVLRGGDPLVCAFVIADARGRTLMDVPFTEVLPVHQWRRERAPQRPAEGVRSSRARLEMARDLFDRTLSGSPIPHALIGLDYELVSVNKAAFMMTSESPERVLGRCVFEAFEGYQDMSAKLEAFYSLARQGLKSRVTNLFYKLPTDTGGEISFWAQAMAWPLLDDDGRVLAMVNCAMQSSTPWADGQCRVAVGHEDA